MKINFKNIILVKIALVMLSTQSMAADALVVEEQLKAALLIKLLNFVEWPQDDNQSSPNITICALGKGSFSRHLDDMEGRISKNKTIVIKHFERSSSLDGGCQIAYISASKKSSLTIIMSNIKALPILSISSIKDFASNGGMIQFVRGHERLNLNINPYAANLSNLKISSLLLEIANIVPTNTKEKNK